MSSARKASENRIWVVGAGFMGRGIAQVCAQYGHTVCLIDPDKKSLAEAKKRIAWSLKKLLAKGEIRENPNQILKKVRYFSGAPHHPKPELLIECVPEDLGKKIQVFRAYDKVCPPETVFASNTSALPIGTLAASTNRGDRFIGTHFSSPPVIQKLVEMIPCLATSEATMRYTKDFLLGIERDIVEVKGDMAGFVMNRIYLAAAGEAIRLLEQGVAPAAEIDRAMRLGFGWAKGPLEAADLAGVDIIRGAMFSIWQDSGNPMFYPPKTLTRLVEAGYLGRKTGRGFYEYPASKRE